MMLLKDNPKVQGIILILYELLCKKKEIYNLLIFFAVNCFQNSSSKS